MIFPIFNYTNKPPMLSAFSFSDDTIGFLIEGNFDMKTLDTLEFQIEAKLTEYDTINLYLEDTNIENFYLEAVVRQIAFKLSLNHRFKKIALVTDRKWIKLCASIENLFSNAEIKNFSSEERIKAMNWIAQGE
jgi:hypothetical protein